MTQRSGLQFAPVLAAALLLASLAGCLGFGSAGSLPAGSIQVSNDASAAQHVTVTVRKIANDSEAIHAANRSRGDPAPAVAIWTRRWNATVDAGATWTEKSAVDEIGTYHIAATARPTTDDVGGTAAGHSDATWLGLYRAGRDGEQVAESTVWVSVDDRQVTISTPSDD